MVSYLVMRAIPYLIPVLVTSVFVALVYAGLVWAGPFLLPVLGMLNRYCGRFTLPELITEYAYFHHSPHTSAVRTFSAFFFTGFNAWICCYLSANVLEIPELMAFLYSVVILNSNFAISLSHELMHSGKKIDRWMATCILLLNGFFYLESDHLYIHHRYVGTERDPASALPGENVYRYLFRSIRSRIKMVFGLTRIFPDPRARRIIQGNYARFLLCILLLIFAFRWDKQVFSWLLVQYLAVTLIYEVITYIQHYGLRRAYTAPGKIEDVDLHHSWNCNYRLSAYLYFMMPVHAIHHLRNEPELEKLTWAGPVFPYPFAQMVTMALIPSAWFKTMNERVNEVEKKLSDL